MLYLIFNDCWIFSFSFLLKNGNKLLARVTAKMKEKSENVDEDICYKKVSHF